MVELIAANFFGELFFFSVHDLHNLDPAKFDASHTVNHISFGKTFPGKTYPLDGRANTEEKGGIMFQYYVKVVPTQYLYLDGRVDNSHQFSVTTNKKDLTTRQFLSFQIRNLVRFGFSEINDSSGKRSLFSSLNFSPIKTTTSCPETFSPLISFQVNQDSQDSSYSTNSAR